MKTYIVGIVGERSYQAAIGGCHAGQRVDICHELGNPHDDQALVVCAGGEPIGYIPKAGFVRDAVFEEGRGVSARIKSIDDGGAGRLGVVLELALTDGALEEILYRETVGRADRLAEKGQTVSTGKPARGLLTRLLKGLFRGARGRAD